MMRDAHFLIKPVSGLCNMRCRYCFYADEMKHRSRACYGRMEEATVQMLLQRAFEGTQRSCTFLFQGGEPTLAGLDFYRRFVELARTLNRKGLQISYALQTNGYGLHEEWAEFFAQEKFLVGLSIDGYAALHDLYRVDGKGDGTARRVLRGAELLRQHGVAFNVLTVVTAQAAKHVEKIYRFFQRQGFAYQQYIPCLDPLGAVRGREQFSLLPEQYEAFLKKLFDLWYADVTRGQPVSIRYFDNLLGMLLGQAPESCGMLGRCARQLVVEADGRVYPCDFYVLDGYCIGNVHTDSMEKLEQNREATGFVEKSLEKDADCLACRWHFLCYGGCRRDREQNGLMERNYFCAAYRGFFDYAYPRLRILAERIAAQSQRPAWIRG